VLFVLKMVTVVGSGCVEHVEAVWACSQHCAMPDTGRSVVPRCDAPIQAEMDRCPQRYVSTFTT